MRPLSAPFAALTFSAAISIPGSTFAQSAACADRDRILERLASDYAESVVARGLTNAGTLLEVTATQDGETWTIVVTAPDGPACLVAAGEAWQPVARPGNPAM